MSTIVGGEYDEKEDVTNYFILPLGQVSLPGKWEKTTYSQVSKQQFFKNQDSINIAIAFGRINQFEFNAKGSLTGFDFLEGYYKWEKDYFESNGMKCPLIESDKTNNYLIYRIYGNHDGSDLDTHVLISEKNGNVSNYSVNITTKWSESEKIQFLKNLLLPSAQ